MESIIVGRSAKRAAVVATIIVASFPLYGCYTPMERALGGGAIGGLGGAGIGALASGGAAYTHPWRSSGRRGSGQSGRAGDYATLLPPTYY